jgi:hypothetical protein
VSRGCHQGSSFRACATAALQLLLLLLLQARHLLLLLLQGFCCQLLLGCLDPYRLRRQHLLFQQIASPTAAAPTAAPQETPFERPKGLAYQVLLVLLPPPSGAGVAGLQLLH